MRLGYLVLAVGILASVGSIQPVPIQQTIYNFNGSGDGSGPGPLVADSAGNLYGVASMGGLETGDCAGGGCGTVFELSLLNGSWVETTLYQFQGGSVQDGSLPLGRLLLDKAGNLYGATEFGGNGSLPSGIIFELSPSAGAWKETILYNFKSEGDGGLPVGNLIADSEGNIYGATESGGKYGNNGVAFELSPSNGGWNESVIHSFGSVGDGSDASSLVFGPDGTLFGTTMFGGNYAYGIAFELVQSNGTWTETILHSFGGSGDGSMPDSPLAFDRTGGALGTTDEGGALNFGTVFALTKSGSTWIEKVLYSFDYTRGSQPSGNLIITKMGDIIGTTVLGFPNWGSIYELQRDRNGWMIINQISFPGAPVGGMYPSGLLAAHGFIFGTAGGGSHDSGVVYQALR